MLSVADPDSGVDVLHVAFGGLGGHAPVVTTLTKQLSLAGIRSGVITYAERTALEANTGAWSDVQVIHPIELKGRLDLVAWRRIFRIVRDLKPRVVILHTLKLAVPTKVALQSMRRTSSTCLLIEHQAIDLRSISYNALSALALPLVEAVVYLSDDYKRRYPFRHWPLSAIRHAVVIPNGVETAEFSPSSRPQERHGVRIGMASRLTSNKDFQTLIRAVSELKRSVPTRSIRLDIAGDGPTLPDLLSLVDRLGLNSEVVFVGHVQGSDLTAFYRKLDVYVQSTYGETASTAILQAMATGLPVVGSDVNGVNDLVQHGKTGLLVAPKDPIEMAMAIGELLDDQSQRVRLGAAGRAEVVAHFGANKIAEAYLRLFASIDIAGPWAGLGGCTAEVSDSA